MDRNEGEVSAVIRELPAVALRGMTILPQTIIHFDLSRKKSVSAVEQAMLEGQRVFLVTQRDTGVNDPDFEQVFPIGTIALIKQISKMPGNLIRVMVEGVARGRLHSFTSQKDYLEGVVEEIQESYALRGTIREEAMVREIKEMLAAYAEFYPKTGDTLTAHMADIYELGRLLDQVTINMPLNFNLKQEVLSVIDLEERYEVLSRILGNEIEIAGIKNELSEKIRGRIDKNQREYMLREQLQFIKDELGEGEGDSISDIEQFEKDLRKLRASKEVKEKIKKEIRRFRNLSYSSSEAAVERGYIETLLEIPWEKRSKDHTDLQKAEDIMNEDHYGLEKVKERIMETLAVRSLCRKGDAPVICLVGPPGVGKTSIAKSIARAMNKEYIRICLGGVRDEAEIRGHRKTYVGAMPGRVIKALKQAGVKNPLILLDEIDKVSSDHKGDTSSALLEVLDGEQNRNFRDHYVEIPVDLSEVLFLATANSTETIPRPLLDRMELIEVTSYTSNEKFHIGKEHLIRKQKEKNGLQEEQLSITDQALQKIIDCYTREGGVRELERKIARICRKAVREILQHGRETISVDAEDLEQYLGKEKYRIERVWEKDEVGVAMGLAWTSVGGDTLQIEVNKMPGKGEIELTGQMGDVMKESALAGLSYIRSIGETYDISPDVFKEYDFHIHIPEGAVPKDGPSAGITMASALLSAASGIPLRAGVAMTGEITLRGRVLPIGGLKEKLLAARTAGVHTVLVPDQNESDVAEISEEIKEGLKIVFVKSMEEVLQQILVLEGGKEENICNGN